GRVLTPFLQTQGHTVRRLVRGKPRGPDEFHWDPMQGSVEPAALGGVNAVVHLAGENVAGGRWTPERKAAILNSRVQGTRALVTAIAARGERPEVFVSASAVGYYGDAGDAEVGEDTPS